MAMVVKSLSLNLWTFNAADEAEKRRKPAKEKEAGAPAEEKKEAKAAETLQS